MTLASWINEDGCTEKNLIMDFSFLASCLVCQYYIVDISYIFQQRYTSMNTNRFVSFNIKSADFGNKECTNFF